MSEHIEWLTADGGRWTNLRFVSDPGDVSDGFGNTNDGPALYASGICIEGTVPQLRQWLIRALTSLPEEKT